MCQTPPRPCPLFFQPVLFWQVKVRSLFINSCDSPRRPQCLRWCMWTKNTCLLWRKTPKISPKRLAELLHTLQWRHTGRDGVSNLQPRHCLLNRLFRHRPEKTPKLRVTSLCTGNSPVTGEFPAQKASNAENGSIWWYHHVVGDIHEYAPHCSVR